MATPRRFLIVLRSSHHKPGSGTAMATGDSTTMAERHEVRCLVSDLVRTAGQLAATYKGQRYSANASTTHYLPEHDCLTAYVEVADGGRKPPGFEAAWQVFNRSEWPWPQEVTTDAEA